MRLKAMRDVSVSASLPIFRDHDVAAEEIARAIEQTPVLIKCLVIRDDSKGLARDTGNPKVVTAMLMASSGGSEFPDAHSMPVIRLVGIPRLD